ncbi:hypothetical protein LXA43DRAFT_894498 [Ganoderma leucocontextum]|nr:hypothetical protein LXA43DRAFT_894498 [Ganoderma leucocontextum]
MDSYPVLPPPSTPPRRPPKRSNQIVGEHFESPRRRRRWRKDAEVVARPDLAILERRFTDQLTQLLGAGDKSCAQESGPSDWEADHESSIPDQCTTPSDLERPLGDAFCDTEANTQVLKESNPRRILPDDASHRLYNNWLALVPTLVGDYLGYMKQTQGRLGRSFEVETHSCLGGKCMLKDWDVQCLHFDCELSRILVRNGLFPMSPSQPRLAVSIDLLDFYFALFERSADAVTALAGALKSMYTRRGFSILNSRNEPIQDPFRRALGQAILWYDALRRHPDDMLEQAVNECITLVTSDKVNGRHTGRLSTDPDKTQARLTVGSCSRILQRRCPACFSGTQFGRNFESHGGDIHVAIDATFSQRHNVTAGESPWFYEPKYFIPKAQVDAMGVRITIARSRPPRTYESQVPDSALDECEKSYEAADEKKEKTHGTKFDDTGLMALVCRHDVVLFLANVDTPGEQQKYGIALIDHLFSQLPGQATVAVFYDIGCVLDRSLQRFDILSKSIIDRLLFATSVMHAYGHQWACQLVYNPRLREGLGLTEGEGTERVWSKFRKLIGVTRSSARARRIWMLDRHADVVNESARENLGAWIRGRLKHGVDARTVAAEDDLSKIAIAVSELREQWLQQRAAQLSVKNHAPAKLKRELDAVLTLQTELDEISGYFRHVRKAISEDASNPEAPRFFESLCRTHQETVNKVEELYSSLNVTDAFPEIQGLPLEFVRTLLLARDLKINIRKRAIGTFFEWDKLDRASGGRDQPLGKRLGLFALHQQTRKAISKRTPALMTAIRKFNQYCAIMKKLYQPTWNFPLPAELPEELNTLREDSNLLSDVWVTRVTPTVPRWMEDPHVRTGIRAVQAKDRCREERIRLGIESDNLCRWYGLELAAIELAIRLAKNAPILFLLRQRKEELLLLQFHWRTPLVSDVRFQAQTLEAIRLAEKLSGSAEPITFHWVHVSIPHEFEDEALDAPQVDEGDSEACLAGDILEIICDQELDPDHVASDYRTCSHRGSVSPAAESVIIPTIEEELWMSDNNPVTLERLHRRDGWLNDDCINLGSDLLLRHLGTAAARGNPALFPSWAVSTHRAGDDDGLWRVCRYAPEFWLKDIWLLPIHRESQSHWTLVIVYWRKRRIAYFDSFGGIASFEDDVKVVFSLLYRLHRLATDRGYAAPPVTARWKAYPLVQPKQDAALQHNGYDCGVWVLAAIAAILRGFTSVDLPHERMAEFRQRLLALIYTSASIV